MEVLCCMDTFIRMGYNMSNRENGIKRYDVGVEANSYMPVSIKQIENFLN